ncbi:hypothetical protein C8R45DRAFT_538967 [Mycena sanguinolenta]|nr:hypothetical protein C8R45DRAFT_538967 [Mycena sanguinolenta]
MYPMSRGIFKIKAFHSPPYCLSSPTTSEPTRPRTRGHYQQRTRENTALWAHGTLKTTKGRPEKAIWEVPGYTRDDSRVVIASPPSSRSRLPNRQLGYCSLCGTAPKWLCRLGASKTLVPAPCCPLVLSCASLFIYLVVPACLIICTVDDCIL